MFILKVEFDEEDQVYWPDTKHANGGTDVLQSAAFNHLFPAGFCSRMWEDLLYDLVSIHGWGLAVTRLPKRQKQQEDTPVYGGRGELVGYVTNRVENTPASGVERVDVDVFVERVLPVDHIIVELQAGKKTEQNNV
jgi:hypothetical protein